jgi:hypothetical protein
MQHEKVLVFLVVSALMAAPAYAIPILTPGDPIIGFDSDGMITNSRYPANEAPANVLDGDPGTKYLNFAGGGSGFIVTPAAQALVQSFTLTTANDAEGRDPATWELYGTNDAIASEDNSTGLAESWTLIGSGAVALPSDRLTLGPVVTVGGVPVPYTSYKMVYPELKGATLMQVADVAFYPTPDGLGPNMLSTLDTILATHAGPDSRTPDHGGEDPMYAIDGDPSTKYLNFGEINSGFIVTPSIGPSIVQSMQMTTANDSAERDPVVWILYGTNDPIASADNSTGTGENWTPIDSGFANLPDDRNTLGSMLTVSGQAEAYTSYKLKFHTVKNADAANSMQIAEVQFYGVPEPATVCLLGLGALALLRRRRA